MPGGPAYLLEPGGLQSSGGSAQLPPFQTPLWAPTPPLLGTQQGGQWAGWSLGSKAGLCLEQGFPASAGLTRCQGLSCGRVSSIPRLHH